MAGVIVRRSINCPILFSCSVPSMSRSLQGDAGWAWLRRRRQHDFVRQALSTVVGEYASRAKPNFRHRFAVSRRKYCSGWELLSKSESALVLGRLVLHDGSIHALGILRRPQVRYGTIQKLSPSLSIVLSLLAIYRVAQEL